MPPSADPLLPHASETPTRHYVMPNLEGDAADPPLACAIMASPAIFLAGVS